MTDNTLYLIAAIVTVVLGAAISITLSRRQRSAARTAVAPNIDITPWAAELALRYEPPGDNGRFPMGRLFGTYQGFETQVHEGVTTDVDGYLQDRTVVVQVMGKPGANWPSAHDPRGLKKLVSTHPHVASALEELKAHEVVIALRRISISLPQEQLTDSQGAPQKLRDVLNAEIKLAQALDRGP